MQKIARTLLYTLSVDTTKNRLYSSKIGFWHDISYSAHFIQSVEQTVTRLSEGFTILSDLCHLQIMSHEWSEIVIQAQKIWIEAGCCGKAEISPKKAVAKIQIDRISNFSGIRKRDFRNKDAAEAWLDQISRNMKGL